MFKIESDYVFKIEDILTTTQKAVVKTFYDNLYHTKLTADKPSILADGIDTATITATVYDYLDKQQTTWTGDIIFELDGVTQSISTTNGVASITFKTSVKGEYTFKTVVDRFRNGEIKVVAG